VASLVHLLGRIRSVDRLPFSFINLWSGATDADN